MFLLQQNNWQQPHTHCKLVPDLLKQYNITTYNNVHKYRNINIFRYCHTKLHEMLFYSLLAKRINACNKYFLIILCRNFIHVIKVNPLVFIPTSLFYFSQNHQETRLYMDVNKQSEFHTNQNQATQIPSIFQRMSKWETDSPSPNTKKNNRQLLKRLSIVTIFSCAAFYTKVGHLDGAQTVQMSFHGILLQEA